MATTYCLLLNGVATADALPAADWNKLAGVVDRNALLLYSLFGGGRKSGWGLNSGTSTVDLGTGQVGPFWCATAASQAISGMAAGTCYVFAKTDAGSPASGTVDFVRRATSAAILNADGVTNAVLLGKCDYNTTTGIHAVDSSIRGDWPIIAVP